MCSFENNATSSLIITGVKQYRLYRAVLPAGRLGSCSVKTLEDHQQFFG